MIEQGTELEANATWSTDVNLIYSNLDMYTWSSSTFKDGLPYYGVLQIKLLEGGKSVNGTVVKICAKPEQQRRNTKNPSTATANNKNSSEICSSFTADASGFVHFSFVPNETDAINYYLNVRSFFQVQL